MEKPTQEQEMIEDDFCQNCGGRGFTIELMPECCMRPTPNGSCCGNAILVEEQIQCPCQYTPPTSINPSDD